MMALLPALCIKRVTDVIYSVQYLIGC